MFYIRDIRVSDLQRVHEFTISLLRHHVGQGTTSQLSVHGLEALFKEGYLMGLLLVQCNGGARNIDSKSESVDDEPVGCMLYHWDVSSIHGGHGVSLDQFYIEPDFRRLGLGRQMMILLCQKVLDSNGSYIKLVYQDGLGLDCVYGKLGFVNHTKRAPGLHAFEVYGMSNLTEFYETGLNLSRRKSLCSVQNLQPTEMQSSLGILVLPLTSGISEGNAYPNWTFSGATPLTTSHTAHVGRFSLPAQAVIVAKNEDNETESHSSGCSQLSVQQGARMCMFVEQCAVCSWLGLLINFSDFVGDLSLLKPKLLVERVQVWTERYPNIRGAVWEVPCGTTFSHPISYQNPMADSVDMAQLVRNPLVASLTRLGVVDDTLREGWNIVYLNKERMRNLIGSSGQQAKLVPSDHESVSSANFVYFLSCQPHEANELG